MTTPGPNCDLRTVQALGSPGAASVPFGYLQPGLMAMGIGSASVNGLTMKGLVAKGSSLTPHPVNPISPMGMGV